MPCKVYREALIEAAASGRGLSSGLQAHVNECPTCGAAFAEETQLFAAIDTGLQVTANANANAEVPALFLPRVRTRLMEQPAAHRSWIPAFAGAGFATVLIVALVLAHKPARNGADANPRAISAAQNVPPAGNQPATPAGALFEVPRTVRKHTRVATVEAALAVATGVAEAEVLIPAGEKQAVDVLLAKLQHGDLPAEALPVEGREKPSKILEVSPLDISPIEINPLSDVESKSAAPDEKTGR